MKNLLILSFLFLGTITFLNAQDTIIENSNYYLQIGEYIDGGKPFEAIDSSQDIPTFEYRWNGYPLTYALEKWMIVLELDTIEYHIDESVSNQIDHFKFRNKNYEYSEPIQPDDSSTIEYHLENDHSRITYYAGYSMIYQEHQLYDKEQYIAIRKEALKVFCDIADLEIEIAQKQINYWKIELVDTINASFSYDQNTHWKRTDLEEYIYYERISYERIVDLLSRKLGVFVKPISKNSKKFDIRMPYSDDVFDLKYSMIEHGLELTEVTEEIDVIIVRAKVEEN